MNDDESENSVQSVSVILKNIYISIAHYWIEWEFNTVHKTMTLQLEEASVALFIAIHLLKINVFSFFCFSKSWLTA